MTKGFHAKQYLKEYDANTPDINLNQLLRFMNQKDTFEFIIGGLFDISKHSGA
jgi:hypothetical protein